MKKVLSNLQKLKYIVIGILVIAIIGLVIVLNNLGVITKLGNAIRRNIFALDEENVETTSYYTIGAVNGDYLTCQIAFENALGIEKITANEVEIDGKSKTKVGVDRILQEGEELQFNVKIVGKEQEELHTIVASTKPTIIVTNADSLGMEAQKKVEIEYPNNENLINYYSVDNGENWEEYIGSFEQSFAIGDGQTEEIKIIAKSEYKEGKTIQKQKLSEYTDSNNSGLIRKVGYAIGHTGYYNININDETYSIHAYVYDNDTIFSDNQIFGDENDVATASAYAKNMIVVKVNGDLTINSGVTLTAYNNSYGGPKGLLLYVTGTLTNNGTISMTARGAKAVGQNVYLWKNQDSTNMEYEYVPAVGAAGGSSKGGSGYNKGGNGINRQTRWRRFRTSRWRIWNFGSRK